MGNHIAHDVVLLKRRSDFRGGTTLRLERSPGYAPARQGHARSKAAQACLPRSTHAWVMPWPIWR